MSDVERLAAQAKGAINAKSWDYTMRESGRLAIDQLVAERQQAIDALRRVMLEHDKVAYAIARNALVKLGEL